MAELKPGMQVRLTNGSTCKVNKELGRGGQGIVYHVDYNGKPYALKWYIIECTEQFYNNLENNVKKGAPSSEFLWPEAITQRQNGSFGYLMKLRPQGYEEISQFLLAKARWGSVEALLNACIHICTAFQRLHINGFSYQDMNDGNFFINPQTGDVLICDNDNVAPDNTNMGILGKAGYMAPEIVDGVAHPNRNTDYFSLSVILFILIYLDRPFKGRRDASCPCLTEELEKKLFGRNCLFIMDPTNADNRPVPGLHKNVIRRWPLFPQLLRDAFIKTFSHEANIAPDKRIGDKQWFKILVQLRSAFVRCPKCGQKTFLEMSQPKSICAECKSALSRPHVLVANGYEIPLVPGQKFYACQTSFLADFTTCTGQVGPNMMIRNEGQTPWSVVTPSGNVKMVNSGEMLPVKAGLKIQFCKDVMGEIK